MVSLVIREGLSRDFADTDQVFLIGNPAFYGRFGFAAERSVAPPFPLSEDWREAWQSIALTPWDASRNDSTRVCEGLYQPTA